MEIEYMRKAHKYTNENMWYLQEEQQCLCINCLSRFSSTEIEESTMDDTANCPYCWMDTVIGENSGYTFTDNEAIMMCEFFMNTFTDGISEHILDLCLFDKFEHLM